ncbi:MAG: hypothetical protein ACI83D_000246, partial [Planctomycetota bacterium]
GNFIGTTKDGGSSIGGNSRGIHLNDDGISTDLTGTLQIGGTFGTTPGGSCTGSCNLISGNQTGDKVGIAISNHAGIGQLLIQSNYIGLDYTGTTSVWNSQGLFINPSTSNSVQSLLVGGTTDAERNIIAGNSSYDVILYLRSQGIDFFGNYIGTDITGNAKPSGATASAGIRVYGYGGAVESPDVNIGGPNAGEGNVIGGGVYGLRIQPYSALNLENIDIQGNSIGVGVDGTSALGGTYGVYMTGSSSNYQGPVRVGGVNAGEGNTISNYTIGAITNLVSGSQFPFLGNHTVNNSGLGIALETSRNHLNDIGDGDTGPNGYLNRPIINNITDAGSGNMTIDYHLDIPAGNYRVEFFSNTTNGPTLNTYVQTGQSETFLEAISIAHTGSGAPENFSFTTTVGGLAVTDSISATATEDLGGSYGATSEISNTAIVSETGIDYGDAPDTGIGTGSGNYNTINTDNGAYHIILPGYYLGSCVDADVSANLQNVNGTADDINISGQASGTCATPGDDDDGVVFQGPLGIGGPNTDVVVTASQAGRISAWIDFDMDGEFGNIASENIFSNQAISAGDTTLSFSTPAGVMAGETMSRFRYTADSQSYHGGLLPVGEATQGEVEDHQVALSYPAEITADKVSLTENVPEVVTVTIDLGQVNTTGFDATATYTLGGGSNDVGIGADLSGPSTGVVIIPNGSQTVDLVYDTTGMDDLLVESNEYLIVTLDSVSLVDSAVVTSTVTVTLIDDEDEDNDGISTVIEDGGFNSGDGNGDGIQDSTQTNVAGVPNPVTGVYTTIVADGGTSTCPAIAAVQMLAESSLATQSNNYDFPTGLVDYTFDCGTNIGGDADISLYYTEQLDTSSYGLVEFDDTTNIFTDVFASASASFANEVLVSGPQAGLTVTKANFKITDGGVLDNDGSANGVITHKVGPSIALNLLSSSSGGGSSTRTSLFGITSQPKIDTSQAGLIEDLAVFLYYDQELDATRLPDPADFLVTLENGITIIPESVVIAKNTVILTLPQSIPPDLEVYLSYTGEHEGIYVEGKYRAASSFELVAIANITESLLLSPGQGSDVDSIIYSGLVCEPYFGVNLQRGAEGDSVRQLQTFLKGVQLYVGTIDGKYGPATTQAVSNFQETYRRFVLEPLSLTNSTGQWSVLTRLMGNFILCQLEATGRTDLRIQSVTQNAPTQSTACPRFTAFLQRGKQNSIQAVQSVQLFLNEYTDAQLVPDGVLGSGTQATIEQFQQTYIDQLPGRRIDGIWGGNSQKVANGLVGC